jgi:lysozyme
MKARIILSFCIVILLSLSIAFAFPEVFNRVFERTTPKQEASVKPKSRNAKIWGLDLSHHNGRIKWEKFVGEDKPDFIYFKVTEGITHVDRKYKKYIKAARNQNINVGSYHFFSYRSDAKKQAKHFHKHAVIKSGDLKPVLDLEYVRRMPKRAKVVSEIEAFIKEFERISDQKLTVYCTERYYDNYLKDLHKKYQFKLWLADYRGTQPKLKHHIWQKTDKYRHPAVRGRVDYNVFHGNQTKFLELFI